MTIYTINPRGQVKASFAGAAETEGYWVSSLSDLPNPAVAGGLTAQQAYVRVPWLFRAVALRAQARSLQGNLSIPGVKAFSTKGVAAGR